MGTERKAPGLVPGLERNGSEWQIAAVPNSPGSQPLPLRGILGIGCHRHTLEIMQLSSIWNPPSAKAEAP